MIQIIVQAQKASCRKSSGERITTGMVGKKVSFDFSAEWDGLVKTAVFEGSGVTKDVVLSEDAAVIPFTVADAAISYAIPLQPGAKEYGIYWNYTQPSGKIPKRSIMVDSSLALYGVMYRCATNETLFLRVFKGPSNILATGQGVGYAAQRFSNGGTNIGSGTDFPAMTLTTDITCATSEIWVYWR